MEVRLGGRVFVSSHFYLYAKAGWGWIKTTIGPYKRNFDMSVGWGSSHPWGFIDQENAAIIIGTN